MLVESTRFGAQDVEEAKIIRMPRGMLGFAEQKRFVLLTPSKPGPFLWLQAVDDPNLAFVVVDAKECIPDYSFSLNAEEFSSLELVDEKSEAIFLLVVTMAPNPYDITVNLQGPIVLNPQRMLARQIVLDKGSYTSRHPFFDPAAKKEASAT
jgi:flagellar assembly factor FliW